MSGSQIFVVYTSGDGNVTLSPRLGAGHRLPEFNSDAKVTLLEGSGVSNGKMVANVKCKDPILFLWLMLIAWRLELQQLVRWYRELC
jgi:hypothetical protein